MTLPLLYDDIKDHCERAISGMTPIDLGLLQVFRAAQVYELTDCVALSADWEREKDRAVPKRPPHPSTWAEWKYTEEGPAGKTLWTLGCLVEGPLSPARIDLIQSDRRGGEAAILTDYCDGRDACITVMFCRMDANYDERGRPKEIVVKGPSVQVGPYIATARPDGSDFRCVWLCPSRESAARGDTINLLRLPAVFSIYSNPHNQVCFPWVPFMAFSLMHCKNVIAVDNKPRAFVQGYRKRAGKPKLVTYKTLKIEAPGAAPAGRRRPDASPDGGPKVRFHLCRGHFRELRSERFANRRGELVWVPQHTRGSRALGEVVTRRRLVPGREGRP